MVQSILGGKQMLLKSLYSTYRGICLFADRKWNVDRTHIQLHQLFISYSNKIT